MKYSIIITEQNSEQYLYKCLDSVASQTYSDFEVIIIDDASDKRKDYIIDKYANINIRYLYLEESRGPGGARNVGLKYADGDYICFLDSDDWWDLDYLENADAILTKTGADIGMTGLRREYDYAVGEPVFKCRYEKQYMLSGEIAFKVMTYEYNMGIKIIPAATNKLYKKSFLNNNDISFIDNILFEDLPFNFEAMRKAEKVVAIPNTLYHHYKRQGSIVQSFKTRNIDDLVFGFTQIRLDLYKENAYEKYMFNYYNLLNHFYNLIVRQIFEFVFDETQRKNLLQMSLNKIKELINAEEYIQYISAEELRKHIQPDITDTTIY